MSPPPQASGPIRRGIGSMTAIFLSRSSHSVDTLVTSAALKSGPAASRKLCGSTQTDGRGRGNGTSTAMAMSPQAPANHTSAINSRMKTLICGDCGIYAGFP